MFDKVLQIGINYHGTNYELSGCENDVKNLNAFLKKDLGASKAQFRILTEKQKDTNLRPTKKNIIDSCQWLVAGATAKSKLFIHYSGHGSWTRDMTGDEKDGRDETICAIDGDIIDDQLRKILIEELPAGCQLWGIFDCCHSGTVMDLRYSYRIDIVNGKTGYHIFPDGKYRDSKCHVCIFSGCADQQTSADAVLGGKWQGAMTWSFIKACRALKRRNRKFRYKEFMKPLIQNLQRKGFTQLPQISTGKWMDLNKQMW